MEMKKYELLKFNSKINIEKKEFLITKSREFIN
jgi:hypothetical protein